MVDFDSELDVALTVFDETFRTLLGSRISDSGKEVIKSLIGNVSVEFNNSFTRTLGRAYVGGRVLFSAPLWVNATPEERREVVIHELMHVVTWRLYPGANAHGKEWKMLMSMVGAVGNRCHKVKLTGINEFACSCMVHNLGPVKAAWVRKGKSYQCKRCRQGLVEIEGSKTTKHMVKAPDTACLPRYICKNTNHG